MKRLEDIGGVKFDNDVVHVFGRLSGGEPYVRTSHLTPVLTPKGVSSFASFI